MKNIYNLRLWLIAAMLSIAYSASATSTKVDGIWYKLNETERTAMVYNGNADYTGDIIIPSEINYYGIKYIVTTISERAFKNCSGLTSITIPNSVTWIGNYAFFGCSGLKEVHISDLAAWCKIDFVSFTSNPLCNANKLYLNDKLITDLEIPDSVTSISKLAFYDCSGLKTVTIPGSVTSIGASAFYGCTNLKTVTIGNSVTKIGDNAFYYCYELSSVTIGNSVTEIGNYAFFYCKSLSSVTIPESVTSIGASAFEDCGMLASVTIPESLTTIGVDAFRYCNRLYKVHISDLEAWCKISFSYCSSNPLYYAQNLYLNDKLITELRIPNTVTSISKYAFYNCTSLKSVMIPNSVTSIGKYAFFNCSGLSWMIFPQSVNSIGQEAFSGCTGISKITIPKTIKTIDSNAFACNDKLEVYVEWDDPSDETLSFAQQPFSDNIMKYGTLYVPTGTKVLYEQTESWKNFANIMEYEFDGIEEIEAEGGVTIGVEGGKIAVTGAGDAKVEVFGTNGAAVYIGSADNLPELAAGIYIVRVGSIGKKVAIAK